MNKLSKIYPKIFNSWRGMKDRCNNKNATQYCDYGGRGIKVCDEWNSFKPFLEWSLLNNHKDGLQIDRIDNNKNYCPKNCRFVSAKENTGVGKRRMPSNNTSGYIGVSYDKANNKWLAQIRIDLFNKKLGRYNTIDEALSARKSAEILLFGKQLTNL